ncbi:hypothetical protein C7G83_07095 [Siccibacter turicensis]|uniref:Uncharacterized protein n=1 Tax=Siccibacter turicensis TaxID=357233 RepID=A0A2P8VNF0_9ENTR|nr:hypothetical protein C7G83_07095 [Siccibacter turicensis]
MSSLQAEGEKFSRSMRVGRVVKGGRWRIAGRESGEMAGGRLILPGGIERGAVSGRIVGNSGKDADENRGTRIGSGSDACSQGGLTPFRVEVWCWRPDICCLPLSQALASDSALAVPVPVLDLNQPADVVRFITC